MNNQNLKNHKPITIEEMAKFIIDKDIKIFLSYSHKDTKKVKNLINYFDNYGISLYVDKRSIKNFESIFKYMESVRDCHFMIPIISQSYLKSNNAMYETVLFRKERDFNERTLPIVLERDEIYSHDAIPNCLAHWDTVICNIKDEMAKLKEPSTPLVELHEEMREIEFTVGRFISFLRDKNTPSFECIKKESLRQLIEYIYVYAKSKLTVGNSEILKKLYFDPIANSLGVKRVENGNYSDDNLYSMLSDAAENGYSLKFLRLAGPTDFRENIISHTDPRSETIKKNAGYNYYELLNSKQIPELEFILVDPFCESLLSKLDAEQNTTWKIKETNIKITKFARSLLRLAKNRQNYVKEGNTLFVGFHQETLIWNLCILDTDTVLLKSYGKKGEIRGHTKVIKSATKENKIPTVEVVFRTESDSFMAESFLKYFNSVSKKSFWFSDESHFSEYINKKRFPSLYRSNAILERDDIFFKQCMDYEAQLQEIAVLSHPKSTTWFKTPRLHGEESFPWLKKVLCMERVQGCSMFELFYKFHEISNLDHEKKQAIEKILGYLFVHSFGALNEFRTLIANDKTFRMHENKPYDYAGKIRSGLLEISPYLIGIRKDSIEGALEDCALIGQVAYNQETAIFRDAHLKNRLIRYDGSINETNDTSDKIASSLAEELLDLDGDQIKEYLDGKIYDIDFEGAILKVSIWDDIAHLFMFENTGFFSLDDDMFDTGTIDRDINIYKFNKIGNHIVKTIETVARVPIPDDQKHGFWMSVFSRILREFFRRIWYANVMPNTYRKRYGLEGRDYYLQLAVLCSFQINGIEQIRQFLIECIKQGNRIWGEIAYRPSISYARPNLN